MARRFIKRPDGSRVMTYAPGDGDLSFVAEYNGAAIPYDVTDAEAESVCPEGWRVYKSGPYHRARPVRISI